MPFALAALIGVRVTFLDSKIIVMYAAARIKYEIVLSLIISTDVQALYGRVVLRSV